MPITFDKDFSFGDAIWGYIKNSENKKLALEVAIEWMQQNLEPEDIFSEKQLSNWAAAAGYVKP